MNFLKWFSDASETEVKKYSKLHDIVSKEFTQLSEEQVLITACVSGLMARVAYVDFHLDEKEAEKIEELMSTFKFNFAAPASRIAKIAIEHIKEMAGLENHLYVHPLNEALDKDTRYQVVQCLFLIAASDGSVEGVETEEIRTIVKGLELSNQHFLAARAEVSDFLKSLN